MPTDRDRPTALPITRPKDTEVIRGDAPGNDGPALSPLAPASMHRAEDDAAAQATSPEFHERPAAGGHTAAGATLETVSERHQPPKSDG